MIKINLLAEGKRAVIRKAKTPLMERRDYGPWILGGLAVLGLLIWGGYWFFLHQKIKQRDQEIVVAQKEVDELAPIIKEVEGYKLKKAELEHKIAVINNLKANQRGPVKLMDQVSRALPELLWLDSMEVAGSNVSLVGQAFNTNAVANFIENLDKVPEFEEPILQNTAQQGPVYGYHVTFTFAIAPPPPPPPAAAAPAGPPPGAMPGTAETPPPPPASGGEN
jgi:type IV pilus assembly protein PilN